MGKRQRKAAAVHAELYSKIPAFECIEGCTDCCGPVPWSAYELKQAGLAGPPPDRADDVCVFSLAGRCDVHAARPLMCRLFGAVEDLRCPHGRGPLTLLPVEAGHEIVRRYKLVNGMR
jgi:Fe-S-cluster containining protein